jgi:hypothetical protein
MSAVQTRPIHYKSVASVYAGKPNKCCCGCSGKHYYARAYREWASKNRGYEVGDEEVSDTHVMMIVRQINEAPEAHFEGEHVYAEVGGQLLIAYLKPQGVDGQPMATDRLIEILKAAGEKPRPYVLERRAGTACIGVDLSTSLLEAVPRLIAACRNSDEAACLFATAREQCGLQNPILSWPQHGWNGHLHA